MAERKIIQPDFLIIPGPVAFSKKIQPADKTIYGVIYWLDSLKDGRCTASNEYIAKVCGMTSKSVGNSLTSLEKAGFIKRLFKDEKKKNRSQILPIVKYGFHQMMEQVPPNDGTNDPSNDGQIRNISKSKSNTVDSQSSSTSTSENSRDAKDRPMNLQNFVDWCAKSNQAHIRIIGEWAETVKPEFETLGQWQVYLKRNFRPATDLVPFSREQIIKAFAEIKKAKSEGWLKKATLETLSKFIIN